MARLMLIDGNSLTYRAFFALPTDMATASGQVTNAVYGFTSMLINLVKDHQPDQVVATFDRPEPTFRHEVVADYKAGRAEAPDILRQQMGLVRQLVETLHIPLVEVTGFEADDVIATLATQAAARGDDVIIVTGDRDTYQLVEDPHVKVLYNKRGVSDYALYDEAGIEDRTGVTPGPLPRVRRPAGRPVRQPARRARRGGEDGGQADQHLRGPRRDLRPPGGAVAEAAARAWPTPKPVVRSNAAATPLATRRPGRGRPGRRRPRRVGPGGAAPAVRFPRVPDPLGPLPRGHRRTGKEAPSPRPAAGVTLEVDVEQLADPHGGRSRRITDWLVARRRPGRRRRVGGSARALRAAAVWPSSRCRRRRARSR